MAPLLLLALLCVYSVSSAPLVTSPWGKLQGVDKTSPTGKAYHGYYGIPYAKPPVGHFRFLPPQQHSQHGTVFDASSSGPYCMQRESQFVLAKPLSVSENCLTLNVVVPATQGSNRTVMVWIHGGAFILGGAAMYEPWKLVTEADVIVVVIQYRLGAFGFLASDNVHAPGNVGLLDQSMALKWVKKNIQSFGGDPNKITVFGESAGAASTSLHTLSPKSKGLFNRFIMQSGSALAPWADNYDYKGQFETVAAAAGCTGPGKHRVPEKIACLRRLPASSLLQATLPMNFVPNVDGHFLVDHPSKLIKNTTFLSDLGFYDLDGMISVNNQEGGLLWEAAVDLDKTFNTSTAGHLDNVYYYQGTVDQILNFTVGYPDPIISEVINYEYTAPRKENQIAIPQQDIFDTYADVAFIAPAIKFARGHSKNNNAGNTFFYYFNHYPTYMDNFKIQGMNHAMDVSYLFGLTKELVGIYGGTGPITQEEYNLADTFVQLIADFAKYGDPNQAVKSKLGQTWKQYDPDDEYYLSFTTHMTLKQHLRSKRVSFWTDLIPHLAAIENARLKASVGNQNQGSSIIG